MYPLLALLLLLLGGLAAEDWGVAADDDGHCDGTLCFAVFSEPADFQTARDQCSELAGHLMTVRTADSHAMLPGLLERAAGPHWVGLSRAAGCPDAAGPLRGFRWDAGDTGSDFSNWWDAAAAADRAGCARRCVSVSSKDGFRWSAGPCDARAAGFLCEYRRGDACEPPGASGSYARPPYAAGRSGDGGGDAEPRPLLRPHGTVFTRDSDGAASMCLSGEWVRAPWPCGMKAGGCEFACGGTDDRPVCLCPPGRAPSREDPAACAPVRGAAAAAAAAAPPPPPPRALRACDRGYRSTLGDDCVDVDECHSAPCEHRCENNHGGFACSCFEGYRPDPANPLRCQRHCGLAECPAECDPNDPEDCTCPAGYILDQRPDESVCMDLNECEHYYCDQLCTNYYGNYTCHCGPGYSLVEGTKCVLGTVAAESTTLSDDVPTSSDAAAAPPPPPRPNPERLSAGGLVAVVVVVAVVVFLAAILVYHFATRRSDVGGGDRDEAHNLEQVGSGLSEKAPPLEE